MGEACSKKILIGLDAIKGYLQISEPTFKKFLRMGLPARVIDSRWYAHKDNLDLYFQKITMGGDEIEEK
jgi:hypothetical protein